MIDITEEDHRLWPPEHLIFPVDSLSLQVLPVDHPFHIAERLEAERNWLQEVDKKPALFNGQVVLQHRLTMDDGVIEGVGHLVPYSTFLWWRAQEPARGGFHLFGFPVLISSDGAIIAIKMAAHTINAGKVYCAAGSLDKDDVANGACDLEGNMMREVLEETGLELSSARADEKLFASHRQRRVTVYRRFHFDRTAEDLIADIRAHMAIDDEQEIADVVAIRSNDPAAHNYDVAMLPLLTWIFGDGA